MNRFASIFLLWTVAVPGVAAQAKEAQDPWLAFVPGIYALVGRGPDQGAAYSGTAVIAVSGNRFTLQRTIGASTTTATGTIEVPSPPGEGKVLRFRSQDAVPQTMTCMVSADLDNHARLGCVWVLENHEHATPGLESYFATAAWPAATAPAADGIAAVWAQEDAYWRYVKAGDVEAYVTLWHPDFIGWPCDQPHPMRKASIGDWVRRVRDEKIKAEVNLVREGAQAFDDIVVVHYRFTNVSTFPDGRVEGAGLEKKITHTWKRVGDTWLIIGGMCGALDASAR